MTTLERGHLSGSLVEDDAALRLASIFTSAATESAFIFRMTWPRCNLTVISAIPSWSAIRLFNMPVTTSAEAPLDELDRVER